MRGYEALAERLAEVRSRIDRACEAAGRDPGDVALLAVSKGHPAAAVKAAWDAGQRTFGENYVQDWLGKCEDPALLGRDLSWHFIGQLQTNKVRFLIGRVRCVETIDRLKLARELSRRAAADGRSVLGLVQVNLAGEASKAGFDREGLLAAWSDLEELPGLHIDGLMAIPPPRESTTEQRADHRAVAELRDELQQRSGRALPVLSLGMSGDFEAAIAEGSTQVRVGTAIFGERPARS